MEDRNFRRRLMMNSGQLPSGYKRLKYIYGMKPSDEEDYTHLSVLPIEIPIKLSSDIVTLNFEGGISNSGVDEYYSSVSCISAILTETNGISVGFTTDTYLGIDTTLYSNDYELNVYIGNFYAYNSSIDCDMYNSFNTKDTILINRGVNSSVDPYVEYINNAYYRPFKYLKLSVNVKDNITTLYNNIKTYIFTTNPNNRSYTGDVLQEFLNGTKTLKINPVYYLIFSFNMTDSNNRKVVDLIPCCRKNDNIYGLYDTVSKAFYTSTDKTYSGSDKNYIKNNIFGGNDLIYGRG